MIFGHKAEKPEYPECRHHPYGLNEPNIVGEDGGGQDHQNQGGHYGHDIDDAVAIFDICPAVRSAIEPQQIFDDKQAHCCYLSPPEDFLRAR